MPKTTLISETLNELARRFVGDGKQLNVYFVTDGPDVVMVTYNGPAALRYWRELAARRPMKESALEDRLVGTLGCVQPETDDGGATLVVHDNSYMDRTLR